MRNLITITAILAGLLFTTTAIASPQEQTIPEPTPTVIAETPTPTPEPEETQTSQPQEGIESHSYGFHNAGCPEGNSIYQIGTQDFTTIFFETIQPSCALLGIRLEAFIPCPHTHAWVRSTPVGTSNTTTPTQLTINRSCQQPEQPATPPPPPLPEQPQTTPETAQPTPTIE